MPTIKKTFTGVAIGGIVQPLVGSQYEYLPWDARVEFAVFAGVGHDADVTIFSGSDVLLENARSDQRALTDPIQYPYDVLVSDVAAAGERLGVTIRNVDTTVIDVRTQVWITPL